MPSAFRWHTITFLYFGLLIRGFQWEILASMEFATCKHWQSLWRHSLRCTDISSLALHQSGIKDEVLCTGIAVYATFSRNIVLFNKAKTLMMCYSIPHSQDPTLVKSVVSVDARFCRACSVMGIQPTDHIIDTCI